MRPMIRTHHFLVATVCIHGPYLVACILIPVRLIDKGGPVSTEVSLAIVPVRGEAGNVFQVLLVRYRVRRVIYQGPPAAAYKQCT